MNKNTSILFLCLGIFVLNACHRQDNDLSKAENKISTDEMVGYIKTLASDEFEGRKPFSNGEKKTLAYLQKVYQDIGLEPANKGSYLQEVPMVEIAGKVEDTLTIKTPGSDMDLEYKKDFVALSRRMEHDIEINNKQLVFCGYGINAPEYQWDDFSGVDVKDKVIVVLVNDPGLDSNDPDFFRSNAMTYYGRWTYKYEQAARMGAAGCLIVHDDKGAGYPWSVVVNSNTSSELYPKPDNGNMDRCKLEGWITQSKAEELFDLLGQNWNELKAEAATPGFKPFPLEATLSFKIENSWKESSSYNVLGMIPGTDLKDEYVIYSAHWDHLGIGKPIDGDSIYHGAVDNGTSLAWMLEIARAFKAMPEAPRRTVVFFAPTAEESGLNGSAWYVKHPVFPIKQTVANINNDLMLPYGKMIDVMITGYGQSDMEDIVEEMAKLQGREILPDPNAHTGMYFRSDHFSFAKVGVPALFARGNVISREHGREWMKEKEANWVKNHYHKPADKYEDSWDLEGVKEDAQLLFRVGWKIANQNDQPQWKEGSEFKVKR